MYIVNIGPLVNYCCDRFGFLVILCMLTRISHEVCMYIVNIGPPVNYCTLMEL